jgi:dTDP-4-amino-4,6-dideoxygalactose transaminase
MRGAQMQDSTAELDVSISPTTDAGVSVPFQDLSRAHAPLAADLREAFDRVAASSGFILGEEVERFESEFASFCGVAHCVGVASGTAALTLSLIAAGIGPGDEVIVPGHTFIASALGVAHAGATVVFCDVEDGTGLIDPMAAAAAITQRTAAIVAVHLYGQAADMAALDELAHRRGLMLLEDAAQAHGATCGGRRVGSLGDAAAFSFYPSKNLGALGDGGAICTDDGDLAERVRRLRNVGQRRKGEHLALGFNERLDGLQAAFLRVKLRHLPSWNERRRSNALAYREGLAQQLLLHERPNTPCVYHLFPIRVDDRDAAIAELARAGIATGVHYTPAASDHPAWRGRAVAGVDKLDAARRWAAHELSLPMFPELDRIELEHVVSSCQHFNYTRGRGECH